MYRIIRRLSAALPLLLVAALALAAGPSAAPAVVHKSSVDVHSGPDFSAPTVANLKRNATVKVAGQQGLWFRIEMPNGTPGYVRVNDVRMQYAGKPAEGSGMRALFTGKAGKGRVSETAGVRGIDESDLKSAGFDAKQFAKFSSNRLSPQAAAAEASRQHWQSRQVAYAGELKPGADRGGKKDATRAQKRGALSTARGLLSAIGVGSSRGNSALDVADAATGKSDAEQQEEELALGPEIAGRILGAAPLWNDDAAQRRVNRIGRWTASQTSRADLPWTFGVVDSPEINAFAAPGGYVLVTRGMYELLSSDDEVAAVLGHEISHAVQRDHYNVIRKQETTAALHQAASSNVPSGSSMAGNMARQYVSRHGATVMLTGLDRDVEYRSDEAAQVYLARAGFDPLALYAVLQKMTALGDASGNLAQLYRTHPTLDDRLDRLDRRSVATGGGRR